MILVIGGAASGKRSYLGSLGFSAGEMAEGVLDDRPVLCNLQVLLRREMPGAAEEDALLALLLQKKAVSCDEVGSGVIPLAREERLYREIVGRLCIRLAEKAEAVVRLSAGIPCIIKGSVPCRFC